MTFIESSLACDLQSDVSIKVARDEDSSPQLWLYAFREGLFYTPLILGGFLYPVCLFWRLKALRRLLIQTAPALRLDIALPILQDEEAVAADLRLDRAAVEDDS